MNDQFIDFENSKFVISIHKNSFDNKIFLSKSISNYTVMKYSPDICEMEMYKTIWKDISFFPNNSIVFTKIENLFNPNFVIKKIYFDDVGYIIFKIVLKAVIKGVIKGKNELGIKIKILGPDQPVKNEVKKNNLLYEKRNTLELSVNDYLVFYISHSK